MTLVQQCLCRAISLTCRTYFTVLLSVNTLMATLSTGSHSAIWNITNLPHGPCVHLHHGPGLDGPFSTSSAVTVRRCLQDLALALHVGRADHCTDGSAAEQSKQRAQEKKAELNSSAMVLAVYVWAAGHLDASRRPQTTLCSPLALWTSWWGTLMSRTWGTGKLCDLSGVTEDAYGKVRISIHLPWSQADCISKYLLCFSVYLVFPMCHPPSWDKCCTDAVTQFLSMAGWPF